MAEGRRVNNAQPLTVRELIDRRAMAERVENPPDLRGVLRRRAVQALRTAELIAAELSNEKVEFRVASTAAPLPTTGLSVQLSVLSGWLQVTVPHDAATLLIRKWSENVGLTNGVPTLVRLSFVIAQRFARHAFGSRYGVKLLGTGELSGAQNLSALLLEVQVKDGEGGGVSGVWRVEFDAEVARRLDWYARRTESERIHCRWKRFQGLFVEGAEDDEARKRC